MKEALPIRRSVMMRPPTDTGAVASLVASVCRLFSIKCYRLCDGVATVVTIREWLYASVPEPLELLSTALEQVSASFFHNDVMCPAWWSVDA